MIRRLSVDERRVWNQLDPTCRTTTGMDAENHRYPEFRHLAVMERALEAQRRARCRAQIQARQSLINLRNDFSTTEEMHP